MFTSFSTLAWLRRYHKCEIVWGDDMASPPSQNQHCPDEAEKAETVTVRDEYIYILYILSGAAVTLQFFNWAEKLLTDINLSPVMSDEEKRFVGFLVLHFRA